MNQNLPLISIIIPIYNTSKYLPKCIDSTINQTYQNIEIILVNDGSTDNSINICNQYKNCNQKIKVIHKENGGLSDARNEGINLATGEYILFLDSDDSLDKFAIEKLYANICFYNSDMAIPNIYIQEDEKNHKQTKRFHFKLKYFSEDPKKFALKIIIEQGRAWRSTSVLYKYNIIKDNNIKFPVGFTSEDIIFNLRFLSHAKKISCIKYSTLICLQRTGSITQSFREDLPDIFLYIHQQIKEFLKVNNIYSKHTDNLRNELLCRNSIICLTEYFSMKNPNNKNIKIEQSIKLLNTNEVKQAFKVKKISPYYENRIKRIYFKLMFLLLKNKKNNTAFILANIAGKFL
jgi:glycosyltransferase involved in cell wall biosynthesis